MRRLAFALALVGGLVFSRDGLGQRLGDAESSLPGVDRVAHALPFDRVVTAALSLGYGFTGGVLNGNEDDTHHRAASSLSASFRPLPALALGFTYANRYDSHKNLEDGDGTDSGWLADSQLFARYVRGVNERVSVGAEALVWFPPGGEPPSFDLGGTSVELTGLVTVSVSPRLRLSANAGFRLDQSADSIDNADMLSRADRLALGVSDYDAFLSGVGASYAVGRFELLGEATWEILVGDGAPDLGESPLGGAAGARVHVSDSIQLQLMARGRFSEIGSFEPMTGLYRADPAFATTFTVSYAHPVEKPVRALDCNLAPDDPACKPTPRIEEPAELVGILTGESGEPIAGAKIVVTVTPDAGGEPIRVETESDAEGRFTLREANGVPLPSGTAALTVTAEGFEPVTRETRITAGAVAELAVPLQEQLPSGQLRGVIQSFQGKPVKAKITVSPGDRVTDTEDSGSFAIDLDPGAYEITISAPGYEGQTRSVVIERNGVTIMNVDLRTGP